MEWLLQQDRALAAGFRNSGTVFGRHGSVTLAVRGTHGLEVPLSDEQGLLVSEHVSSTECNRPPEPLHVGTEGPKIVTLFQLEPPLFHT